MPAAARLPTPHLQARVRAIAEIVGALVGGVKRGEDVDLNAVKREVGGCMQMQEGVPVGRSGRSFGVIAAGAGPLTLPA